MLWWCRNLTNLTQPRDRFVSEDQECWSRHADQGQGVPRRDQVAH
jgi:hypothetical protein